MARRQKGSRHAAKGSSRFKLFGDWPNINLILTDETGAAVDYGYDTRALKRQQDTPASAGDRVGRKGTRTFDFHTQLTLDETTFDDVRVELEKRTKAGRQKAYRILKKSATWDIGGPAGKKMIKEALQAIFA